MKKNTRIISLAAAALLAVAPVVSSAVPVNAADTTLGSTTTAQPSQTTQITGSTPYFYTNGSAPVYNNGEMSQMNAGKFTKVSDIVKAINDNINFAQNGSNGAGRKEDITPAEVIRQLRDQNISVTKVTGSGASQDGDLGTLPPNFHITLQHTLNNVAYKVTVPFYTTSNAPAADTSAPVFYVTKGNGSATEATNGQYYQVAQGSNFNPLSFTNSNGETVTFSARQSTGNGAAATISTSSNPVDTTTPGRFYTVRLTASNQAGKTTSYSYVVLIVSNGLQKVYANGATSVPTYNIFGNQVSSNSTTFKDGQEVYVGNTTREINKVSYTKVSTTSKANADSSSNNLWIQTSALTQTTPATDSNTATHTVMVDSRAYDKNGNYLGHMYYAYDNIDIVPTVVTINGKTYYKVANKDEYVRVTNITGNQRKLRHNAYVYWSSYRRTPGVRKMYKGETITTYGPQMRFKNGKKYYRIEGCRNNNKRYIKAVNFY